MQRIGLLTAVLVACQPPPEVCVPLEEVNQTPALSLAINDVPGSFILDTGLLFLLLNPAWKAQGFPETEAVEYRMWGKPHTAWLVDSPRLSVGGTALSAVLSTEWALLSQEKSWCYDKDDQQGCDGIVGGVALGHVARQIRHERSGEVCLTEGPCRNLLPLRSPLPVVEAEVEGQTMTFLFDSGAIYTRAFHQMAAATPDIIVPGLPEPLIGRETPPEELERLFQTRTLNGIEFDGVIGWEDIKRTLWRWNPCKGIVEFHGYIERAE